MVKTNDLHLQFASYFPDENIWPFLYTLSKKNSEGNICIHVDAPMDLPEFFTNTKVDKSYLSTSTIIGNRADLNNPFILDGDKLYMQRYYKYETLIIDKIKELVISEDTMQNDRIEFLEKNKSTIAKLFSETDIPDWQLVACIVAFLKNIFILTGGPGTGKTTAVAKILTILLLQNPDLKIALTAPTGKAAMRMAESLSRTNVFVNATIQGNIKSIVPQTIHRLLGYKKNSIYFKYNEQNPLPYDVIVVDESSMIDTALFAKLLSAISVGTRVFFLGDKNQLASVEAGSIFGDICKLLPDNNLYTEDTINVLREYTHVDLHTSNSNTSLIVDHITELKHSHRFDAEKGIGKFSQAVINNNQTILTEFLESNIVEPEVKIDLNYSDSLFFDFVRNFEAYLEENDIQQALYKLDICRVLCAVREGKNGTLNNNYEIENYFIKRGLIQKRYDAEFYENRPIIVTKNSYDLNLFNGDIGIIRDGKAWFLGKESSNTEGIRAVNPALIPAMETVFAMTIHKSQGSEFDKVLMILPEVDTHRLLTRELLYTGITRAKSSVYIQSEKTIFLDACEQQVSRVSGINERL